MESEIAFAHAGTVSHGTIRPDCLIVAFADVLREIAPARYDAIIEHQPAHRALYAWATGSATQPMMQPRTGPNGHTTGFDEDMDWLVEDLRDALVEVAPTGYRFGAHHGDGADVGFWPTDPQEDA